MQASEDHLRQHYSDLSARPFFPGLVKYMASGPVVPMVWEGLNVVKTGRVMLGETNPRDSKPGTIRGDYCIQVGRNICHGSDSVESANKEINLWFKGDELTAWTPAAIDWVYGENWNWSWTAFRKQLRFSEFYSFELIWGYDNTIPIYLMLFRKAFIGR